MRALVYARLSRARDESTAIQRQLEACRAEAERRGWTVAGEYVDDGVSGAMDPSARPQMSRLLAALDGADVILVWKLDRLARSFLSFADLMRVCESSGVGMTSVTEPLDTTSPMGRAMVQIIAVFAELERAMIRERIVASKDYLRSVGKHWTGHAPYGLRIVQAPDGKGKVLERDPGAVAVIREVADRLIAGESGSAIASDLQRRGVQSPRVRTALVANPKPSAWSFQGIHKILNHPSILGHRADERGHVQRGEDGAPLLFWEQALPAEDLAAARLAMAVRSGSRSAPQREHWLRGVAVCGKCGRDLAQNANHGRDGATMLRCTGTREDPCRGVLVREAELSDFVELEFLGAAGRLPAVERVFVPGSEDVGPELESIERTIRNLRDDRDAGLFDDDEADYRARMASLVARRKTLREAPVTESGWELRDLGVTMADHWETLEPAERGALLRSMGLQAVVYPANGRRMAVAERAELVGGPEEYSDED